MPTTDLPTTKDGLLKEEAKVRHELAAARREHSLQKLGSPATLRKLRVRLARVLTMQAKLQKKDNHGS